MNATEACIALNMLPTVGPVRLRKLLEVFKQPQQILAAKTQTNSEKLKESGVKWPIKLAAGSRSSIFGAELDRIREFGATVITRESPSYPNSLREIHAPPIVLYVWGELQERDHHAIGIIGARRTTHYGMESAKKARVSTRLCRIDYSQRTRRAESIPPHIKGRLAAKGPHDRRDRLRTGEALSAGERWPLLKKFEQEMVRSCRNFRWKLNRTVKTFPMRKPGSFSGWSHGILVVEAGLNSGALITASQAIEQGRSVYRCAWPYQRAERDGIQSSYPARRQAGHGTPATSWMICRFFCLRRKPTAEAARAPPCRLFSEDETPHLPRHRSDGDIN